jgi:hypothetical protein
VVVVLVMVVVGDVVIFNCCRCHPCVLVLVLVENIKVKHDDDDGFVCVYDACVMRACACM